MAEPIEPVKGAAFPFAIDPRSGGVATTEGAAKVKENLEHLLLSHAGERVMLREYGGGVSQLYQENINDGLIAVARLQIGGAMLRHARMPAASGSIDSEVGPVEHGR